MTGHLPEPKGWRLRGSRALYLESHHRRGSDHCKATSPSGWQHITPGSAPGTWMNTVRSATAPQTCHLACKSHSKASLQGKKSHLLPILSLDRDPDLYHLIISTARFCSSVQLGRALHDTDTCYCHCHRRQHLLLSNGGERQRGALRLYLTQCFQNKVLGFLTH